jgi:hypothetical protein
MNWLGDGSLAAPEVLVATADEGQTFYTTVSRTSWIKLRPRL